MLDNNKHYDKLALVKIENGLDNLTTAVIALQSVDGKHSGLEGYISDLYSKLGVDLSAMFAIKAPVEAPVEASVEKKVDTPPSKGTIKQGEKTSKKTSKNNEKKVDTPPSKQAVRYAQVETYPTVDVEVYSGKDGDSLLNTDKVFFLHALNAIPFFANGNVKAGEMGTHPFFKGSASFLTYLPVEVRAKYMNILKSSPEYRRQPSDVFTLTDLADKLKKGIDPSMMASMIVDEGKTIFDLMDSRYIPVSNVQFIETISQGEGLKKLNSVLNIITHDYPVAFFNFMTFNGINKEILDDIVAIAKAHKNNPNPDVGYMTSDRKLLDKIEQQGFNFQKRPYWKFEK